VTEGRNTLRSCNQGKLFTLCPVVVVQTTLAVSLGCFVGACQRAAPVESLVQFRADLCLGAFVASCACELFLRVGPSCCCCCELDLGVVVVAS
jgi:hypothetical protein